VIGRVVLVQAERLDRRGQRHSREDVEQREQAGQEQVGALSFEPQFTTHRPAYRVRGRLITAGALVWWLPRPESISTYAQRRNGRSPGMNGAWWTVEAGLRHPKAAEFG